MKPPLKCQIFDVNSSAFFQNFAAVHVMRLENNWVHSFTSNFLLFNFTWSAVDNSALKLQWKLKALLGFFFQNLKGYVHIRGLRIQSSILSTQKYRKGIVLVLFQENEEDEKQPWHACQRAKVFLGQLFRQNRLLKIKS